MNSFNKEEEEKIKEDTFLLDNLPGAKEMLSLALPNKDILYYPFSSNACQNLKAFDFISQKNVNEQDNNNFVSIEIKNVTNPQKVKKIKKIKISIIITFKKKMFSKKINICLLSQNSKCRNQ